MKVLMFGRKRLAVIIFAVVIFCMIAVNAVGYFMNVKYISVFAAMSETDRFKIESQLLKEAMEKVGVCSPDEAVHIWAQGLKERSAAMQYAVMTPDLKKKYERQLDELKSNWVTGVSSPWVEKYEILEKEKSGKGRYTYKLRFDTATSSGPYASYQAELEVVLNNNFWQIGEIRGDEGIYTYTLYR